MMENFEAEQPMLGPVNPEYNLMGEKELTQFQIKEVIDSKKRAIDDLSKANTKTVNYNYSEEQKELAKKQGVNLPSTSYVEPFAKTALVRLKQDIANLEKDMVNNLNGLEITDETKQLLQMYRQGTENEDGSLDPVVIKEPIETPPIKEMGKQWMETKQGKMISPERTKKTTVMRPKTAQERSAMLEGMIGERAEDLGVQGIKDITELTKSIKPELVELGGFKYVVSSKTGAFQLLPGQEQKGATPEQIKAMKALGYQPKTATLTLGNGITMQMEVPPQKDGSNRTEGQAQAFLHNGLMNDSEDIIQKIKQEESFDPTSLTGDFELYHNIELARSPEAKQYAAAMNKWIESYLRYVSGAAIAEHEYKGARSQFFPVVGDSEENIEIKRQRRVKTMNLLKEVSGGGSINELVNFSDNLVDLQTGKAAPISLFRTSDPDEAFQMAKEKGMKAGQKVKYYDPETATFKTIILK